MTSDSSDIKQDRPWLFKKGQSGNPAGRPKGTKSLKTWAKEYLMSLDDDEKMEFIEGLPKQEIWKMAEGLPQQDVTTGGEKLPAPLLHVLHNDSDKKDSGAQ